MSLLVILLFELMDGHQPHYEQYSEKCSITDTQTHRHTHRRIHMLILTHAANTQSHKCSTCAHALTHMQTNTNTHTHTLSMMLMLTHVRGAPG